MWESLHCLFTKSVANPPIAASTDNSASKRPTSQTLRTTASQRLPPPSSLSGRTTRFASKQSLPPTSKLRPTVLNRAIFCPPNRPVSSGPSKPSSPPGWSKVYNQLLKDLQTTENQRLENELSMFLKGSFDLEQGSFAQHDSSFVDDFLFSV